MNEYNSSEELQRANRNVFSDKDAEKDAQAQRSEKDKLHKVLDKYIKKHGYAKDVRDMAVEHNRTADQQLDLSASLIEILEKIKIELR
jgi:hypothetical protein